MEGGNSSIEASLIDPLMVSGNSPPKQDEDDEDNDENEEDL